MRNATVPTSIPPETFATMNAMPITAGWLADRLGCSRLAAGQLLTRAGATYSNGRYRFAGTAPKTFGDQRACVKSEHSGTTFTAKDKA
jgi:hypothetical protein